MPFLLYDYLNTSSENDFKAWTKALQPSERAKLNQKLDMLEKYGEALFPNTLTGTAIAGIFKLRIHGKVQLRPLLCRGPKHEEQAFTLLAGAKEIGSVLKPKGIESVADGRKTEVIRDPDNRRKPHVRITK